MVLPLLTSTGSHFFKQVYFSHLGSEHRHYQLSGKSYSELPLCHPRKSCQIKASKLFTFNMSNMDHILCLQPSSSRPTSDCESSKPEPPALWRAEVACLHFPDQSYKQWRILRELRFRADRHVTAAAAVPAPMARQPKAHLGHYLELPQ